MAIEGDKAAQLNASFHGMARLPVLRQVGLLLGLAISLALGMSVALWPGSPDYSVLSRQNSERDTAEILKVLRQRNISFKLDNHSGMIMVESGKVNEAHKALAAQDLPHLVSDSYDLPVKQRDYTANGFFQNTRYQHALEIELAHNIENILSPIVGSNKVRALVVASMNFTQGVAAKSGRHSLTSAMATHNHERLGTGAKGNGNKQPQLRFSDVDDQAHLAVAHRQVQPEIKRLSVAVVVDHKMLRKNEGEVVSTRYTKDELQRFTTLAKEAVGFDAKRGDTIGVINAEFATAPDLETIATTPILDKAWVRDVGRQLPAMLLVALILLGVVRPVMRNLASVPYSKREVIGDGATAKEQVTLVEERTRNIPGSNYYESDLEKIKSLGIREPKRVAKVVKQWLSEG